MSTSKTDDCLELAWTAEITTVKPVTPSVPPEETLAKKLLALILAAISGLSVAISSVCRKHLPSVPPTQLVVHRYIGVMLYSMSAMMYYRQTPLQSKKLTIILIFRGLCLGSAYILAYISLNYIPLAEFSVLSGCTPVFATIMARLFLKEECGLIHVLCLILTMLGIVLVSKFPVVVMERTIPYGLSYYKGIAITLLLSAMVALGAVSTRCQELKKLDHSVIMFFLGASSVVECLMASAAYGYSQLSCDSGNWLVLLLSLAGIGVDLTGTIALKYQPAAILAMVYSSANIVGSYIWQIAVDGVKPDAYTISGTVVMVLCLLLLTLKQTVPWKINRKTLSWC